MALKERLKRLRKAARLTQTDVATLGGLAQTTVSQIETGKIADVRPDTLCKLADVFGVTVDYLLSRSDKPRPAAAGREPARTHRSENGTIHVPVTGSAAADTSGGQVTLDAITEEEPYTLSETARCVRVDGDSMFPLAWSDQFAIIAGPERSAQSGDLVVVLSRSRGLLFKRLFISTRRRRKAYILTSVNPVQPVEPIEIPEADVLDMRVVTGVFYE